MYSDSFTCLWLPLIKLLPKTEFCPDVDFVQAVLCSVRLLECKLLHSRFQVNSWLCICISQNPRSADSEWLGCLVGEKAGFSVSSLCSPRRTGSGQASPMWFLAWGPPGPYSGAGRPRLSLCGRSWAGDWWSGERRLQPSLAQWSTPDRYCFEPDRCSFLCHKLLLLWWLRCHFHAGCIFR